MTIDNKRKHLEFIQKTMARMAQNSFFLKGWAITLVAVLFGLFVKDENLYFSVNYLSFAYLLVIVLPVIVFWVLDGYFLSQERLFRDLYDHVRKLDEQEIDFSMDISKYEEDSRNGWLSSMFSKTLLVFYLSIIALYPVFGVIYLLSLKLC